MANEHALYEEALRRGHAFCWDQRWNEAIEAFQQAISAVDNEPAAYAGLGMAYYELGQYEKALEHYKQAARFSHGDMIYLKPVADVQERLGQLTDAGQTYMAIGEIQLRRKKLDEAVGNWLRAVRLDPDLLNGHQRLAAVYRRQGLTRNAIREYLAMARIYYARGEQDEAIKICQSALELDPRNADVLTALELIRQGEEFMPRDDQPRVDPRKAAERAEEAVQRMTATFEAESESWRLNGDKKKQTLLESALRLAQQQLAKEIFSEEDDDQGPVFGKGLNKLERDALISQALDFHTRNMAEEAISCYERAIAGGVDSPAACFCLGLLYSEQKKGDRAFTYLEYAAQADDFFIACHYGMGELQRQRNHIEEAVRHYIVALKKLDHQHISAEKSGRIDGLYDSLAESLFAESDLDSENSFIYSVTGFLGQRGWLEKVKEARAQLDRLSDGSRILILGDMLAAGSPQVMESLYLSQDYAEHSRFNSAIEEAYRAIQLSPHYLPAHIQLAELMARQERGEIAVAKFLTIGDTYRVRGDIEGAINSYERVVDLSPLDLANRARLISVLIDQDRIDRALEHYMVMGEAYYNLAETDQARRTYIEALKLAPRGMPEQKWRFRLLRAIADIDMQRLDWKRALMAYNELSAADAEDQTIALTLIDLHYKAGQPRTALQQLDQYLVRLVRSGKGAQVTGILEYLVEQRPADAGLNDRLVRLRIRQGRKQEAIEMLDRLGEAQLEAGEPQKAAATIDRLLELDPPNAASYRQLLQRLQQNTA